MRRRTLLATTSALLAGCTGATERGDGPTPSTRTTSTTATTSTETTTTATTTEQPYDRLPPDPASMTADEVQQRLEGRDCSTLSDLPTTCPGDDGRLDVSVSPTVDVFADGPVEFTVENTADEAFRWNPYDWLLRKWDGSRWRRLAPLAIPAPLDRIPAGESHAYRIARGENHPVRNPRAYIAERGVAVGGLGPGVYGFSTQGYFESASDDELAAAAVFGFAGDAPPVRPTDAVSHVERDGSELVVHAVNPERGAGTVTVSLVDGVADARLLPEHVHQVAALRNSLPYAASDGVETIRCITNEDDAGWADTYLSAVTPDDTARYGFRDLTFEVSVGET